MLLCLSTHSRDGEQIEQEEDDEKYIFSDDSSQLTIKKVDKNDEAEYICIAENKAGEQDATIHLKVFGKSNGGPGHCSATIPLPLHIQSISKTLVTLPQNITQCTHFLPVPSPKP